MSIVYCVLLSQTKTEKLCPLWVRMVAKTARKKKTSNTVKQKLLNFTKEDDDLEETDIGATADIITDPLEAIRLI